MCCEVTCALFPPSWKAAAPATMRWLERTTSVSCRAQGECVSTVVFQGNNKVEGMRSGSGWTAASGHLHDVLHALRVDDVAPAALRDVGEQHAAAALRHKLLDAVDEAQQAGASEGAAPTDCRSNQKLLCRARCTLGAERATPVAFARCV